MNPETFSSSCERCEKNYCDKFEQSGKLMCYECFLIFDNYISPCSDCGKNYCDKFVEFNKILCEECIYSCEICKAIFYENKPCNKCEKIICSKCTYDCKFCRQNICESCSLECLYCEKTICYDCLVSCTECKRISFCNWCFSRNGISKFCSYCKK